MKFVPRSVNPEITKHSTHNLKPTLIYSHTIQIRLCRFNDIRQLKNCIAASFAWNGVALQYLRPCLMYKETN